jgi:hypothetical protein
MDFGHITAELRTRSLDQLLSEAVEWTEVLRHSDPYHADALQPMLDELAMRKHALEQHIIPFWPPLRRIQTSRELTRKRNLLYEKLVGYCARFRREHEGMTPSEVRSMMV